MTEISRVELVKLCNELKEASLKVSSFKEANCNTRPVSKLHMLLSGLEQTLDHNETLEQLIQDQHKALFELMRANDSLEAENKKLKHQIAMMAKPALFHC